MAFISNDLLQAALVAYLKLQPTLTSVTTATEIRENTWKGADFNYPNVRVELTRNVPEKDGCPQYIDVTFQVYSETTTSKQADQIAGIITTILHDKQFGQNGLKIYLYAVNVQPAYAEGVPTWRSNVQMTGKVT